jgi:hypothetical protein
LTIFIFHILYPCSCPVRRIIFLVIISFLSFSSISSAEDEIAVDGIAGYSIIVQDEDTTLSPRPYLNFTGAGVTAATSGGKMNVTISGGGASAGALDVQLSGASVCTDASCDTVTFSNDFSITESATNTASVGLSNITVDTINTFTFNQSVASGATPTFTNTNFTASANKNYVTDAQLVVIGNTSGANTGDNDQVGSVTLGKLCVGDGSLVQCTEDAPAGAGDITRVGDCLDGDCLVTGGNITADTVSATTFTGNLIGGLGGNFDAGAYNMLVSSGTTLVSGDCDNAAEAGRIFVKTDAATGQQWYVCEGAAGWVVQGGGTTAINNLGDASGAGEVALAGNQQTWTSTLNSAGANLTMTNTTADLTADVSFMDLKYTDDGDVNGFFLRGYDNAATDLKFSIGAGGAADFRGAVTGLSFTADPSAAPELSMTDSNDEESPQIKSFRAVSNLTTTTADAQVGDATFYTPIGGSDVAFITRDGSGPTTTIANLVAASPSFTTAVTITEGILSDSTIVSADIKDLTIVTGDIAADTITHANMADSDQECGGQIWFENPTAADDFKSIWANKGANDCQLTEMWGESDQTVNFTLLVDDGSPAPINGNLEPAAGEAEDTSLTGDTVVAAGEELDLQINSVTNTPTWVSIKWTGNWAD